VALPFLSGGSKTLSVTDNSHGPSGDVGNRILEMSGRPVNSKQATTNFKLATEAGNRPAPGIERITNVQRLA
jgi:hypothetical protein